MSYTINSNQFSVYKLTALSSHGTLDFPKRLGEYEYDWGDSNGIESYVSAADLFWDGREISVKCFYSGNNYALDIQDILALRGTDLTLVSTFGTHNVRLLKVKEQTVVKNKKAIVDVVFWEPSVSASTPASAVGGSGMSYGGYDFRVDFGLYVKKVSGYGERLFDPRDLSYGNTSKILSPYGKNRTVTILLNGKYANLTAMISKVNALKNVLMSAGNKVLSYNSTSYTAYFAEGAKVEADPKKLVATINLKLKIKE